MNGPPSDEGESFPEYAVVLGAGGIVGTAWTAGLASGLRREGTDLGRADLIAVHDWPARRLLVTAVEVDTGEPVVWDRTSGVPLPTAVAASTAMPGAYPPITIGGRRYMDGGIRSGTNADLGAGADVLVVVDPFAHLFPRDHLEWELAAAKARRVVTIEPDRDAVDVFGSDPLDGAGRRPAYRAGERQAVEVAERLQRAGW